MGLVGLLNAQQDFWARQDAVVLSMSSDRQSRLGAAQYRQLAETARATWAQAEIQHASFTLLDIQCRQLNEINGTLSATFDLLQNTNTQLAGISGQLAETNEHLKGLRATQDEHLLLIKRERTLKEVVFQLGNLIDSAVNKEDAVSAFAYHRYSLATLDRYQLGTADLSALEDKKEFDRFIKNSRGVVRNAVSETTQSLEDFEATYLLYQKRLEVGVVHDIPRKQQLPTFTPKTLPVFWASPVREWQPRPVEPAPVYEKREPPQKRSVSDSRSFLHERKPKLDLPVCPVAGPPGSPPQPPDASLLPPGYSPPSWEHIPTQSETDARVPPRQLWELFTYPKDRMRAREYEDGLRAWKNNKDAYAAWQHKCAELSEAYEKVLAKWNEALAGIDEEERRIEDKHLKRLEQFEANEEVRKAEYESLVTDYQQRQKTIQEEEEKRRIEHAVVAESIRRENEARNTEMRSAFELAEKQRFDEHLANWREVKDANAKLEERLQQAVKLYEDAIAAYGRLINEYLDEHSDLQVFYCKVNPVADLVKYRRDWKEKAFGGDDFGEELPEPVYHAINWDLQQKKGEGDLQEEMRQREADINSRLQRFRSQKRLRSSQKRLGL